MGLGVGAFAVGDFTNDGKLDLVTANAFSNTVSMLIGHGDGTLDRKELVSLIERAIRLRTPERHAAR